MAQTNSIYIIAEFNVYKDKIDEFKNITSQSPIIRLSNEEVGCIFYNFTQSKEDPSKFAMIECWKDSIAIDFHFSTEHFKAFRPTIAHLLDGPVKVSKYDFIA
eukprot:TRINITY_DN375_c0_g1_i2.p1 TRINITY_DN375_c0_g1~~TRINITY_DN375_c0_g1_i2.p1  ORF type:complete len:103 (-),score=51.20 TRINITY_DN375_c0_g1_i2:61-369(-)